MATGSTLSPFDHSVQKEAFSDMANGGGVISSISQMGIHAIDASRANQILGDD